MKSMIEDLWRSCLMDNPVGKQSKREKELLGRLIEIDKQIEECFTKEQQEILKQQEACLDEIQELSEKNAFFKAVHFTARFLLEALYG